MGLCQKTNDSCPVRWSQAKVIFSSVFLSDLNWAGVFKKKKVTPTLCLYSFNLCDGLAYFFSKNTAELIDLRQNKKKIFLTKFDKNVKLVLKIESPIFLHLLLCTTSVRASDNNGWWFYKSVMGRSVGDVQTINRVFTCCSGLFVPSDG